MDADNALETITMRSRLTTGFVVQIDEDSINSFSLLVFHETGECRESLTNDFAYYMGSRQSQSQIRKPSKSPVQCANQNQHNMYVCCATDTETEMEPASTVRHALCKTCRLASDQQQVTNIHKPTDVSPIPSQGCSCESRREKLPRPPATIA